MRPEVNQRVRAVLRAQARIITMKQAQGAGLTRSFIKRRLAGGHWARRYRGVYVTVTGKVSREAELRAALLRAGQGAVLSHWTAAELQGLVDKPYPVIHITVPEKRNPAPSRPDTWRRCGISWRGR